MPSELITYFAYGANLELAGMRMRCPGCQPLSRAALPDHRLVFRGVGDVEPETGAIVQGALYRITPEHLKSLDHMEGYPCMYIRKILTVIPASGEPVKAILYQMRDRRGYASPFKNYLNIILTGCRDWSIDEEYIRSLIRAAAASNFGEY